MKLRTKILVSLILLALVDLVIPVPITALILAYVLFERPAWFLRCVKEIYT